MSNQVQCPNCGGYKIDVEKVESIGTYTRNDIGTGCLVYLISLFIILPIYMFLIAVVIALFIMVITIPLAIWLYRGMNSASLSIVNAMRGYVEQAKKYWLKCELCGYAWIWRTDEPYPSIQTRPELIAQGEQKLAADRRKQQEDAAALYHLTHQGKQ